MNDVSREGLSHCRRDAQGSPPGNCGRTPDPRDPERRVDQMLTVILEGGKAARLEIPDEATFGIETVGPFDELVRMLAAERAPRMRADGGTQRW